MELPLSLNYTLSMGGEAVPVYRTEVADFAIACFTGTKEFVISAEEPFESAVIRPARPERRAGVSGREIRATLTDCERVSVEPYGRQNPLFIFCSKPVPQPDNATHIYKRGTVADIGALELTSGDCVYIEEGAVVVGGFFADRQRDIRIVGNGVMWGSPLRERGPAGKMKMIMPVQCENVHIEGLTLIDCPTWHVVPIACSGVTIRNLNIIGVVMSGDGIDVVGCEDVDIAHCFIRVNDDCLVVKANRYDDPRGCKDAKRIRASDCVLWKAKCGNAIEIGYETSCEEICDVAFEDIDVIHCELEGWQSGGVFTIHNGDRAHVHDILYRNIRIEEADEKLIDIKILTSKYSVDKWRGKVSGIRFDGIYYTGDILPASIVRGYESDLGEPNLITGIEIKDLYRNGEKIVDRRHAHLIAELSLDISFV